MRPYHCLPIDANTLAYYRPGEWLSLLTDQSGNGQTLTAYNGVTVGEDGAHFTRASSQYARRIGTIDLSAKTALTFECWFRLDSQPTGLVYGLLSLYYSPRLYFGGSTLRWQTYYTDASNSYVDYTWAGADLGWHHIAGVWQRNTAGGLKLYLDGLSVGTPQNTPDLALRDYGATNQIITVGAEGSWTNTFDGTIDEACFSWAARYTAAFVPRRFADGARSVIRGPGEPYPVLGGVGTAA